jgi:hypothetical protein
VNTAVVIMSVHVNIVTAKTDAATCEAIIVRIVFAIAKENNGTVRKPVTGRGIITNIFRRSRPQ